MIWWTKLCRYNQINIGFGCLLLFFLADVLLDSSLLEWYNKLTPSSAAMCFRQTTVSNLYTEIIFNLMHFRVSDVQSLFLCFTALAVAGHLNSTITFCSIIVKALHNLLRWGALLYHSAYYLAIDQSQLRTVINVICIFLWNLNFQFNQLIHSLDTTMSQSRQQFLWHLAFEFG